ncbi:MAG: methyltransferase domain-containing protein [Myxococcales bacterium]|nr:methyltransferase domain-containing protein [Myxococcales bacterium]
MRRAFLLPLPLLWACASASGPAQGPASGPADGPHAHGDHGHGDHGRHMEHAFDDPEAWAKRFDDPARDAWQKPEEVVALMALSPGQTAADIGAGTGYFLPHLSRAVGPEGKVLGLDIEPKLVAYMNARAAKEGLANVEAKQVAPDDPGLSPASVDRVLIVDTWHHIDRRGEYAQKIRAGLRPGGALFVVDFTLDSPHGPPAEFRLSAESVRDTLLAAGFEAEVLEETLPNQYVVRGRRPLED